MAAEIKKTKRLPMEGDTDVFKSEFIANGNKYTILKPSEIFGIERYTQYNAYRTLMAFNFSDFQGMYDYIVKMEKAWEKAMQDKGSFVDVAVMIREMKESVLGFGKQKYDVSFILCTLFVARDGEDMATFSSTLSDSKIEDWKKEGYSAMDFFSLAVSFSQDYKNVVLKALEVGEKE